MEKVLAVDNNVDIQVDLACTIVDCLSSPQTTVSYGAVKCLKRFQSTVTLSSHPILSKLLGTVAMDSKIRARVYDVSYLLIYCSFIKMLNMLGSKTISSFYKFVIRMSTDFNSLGQVSRCFSDDQF